MENFTINKIDDDFVEMEESQKEKWGIDNDGTADWALQKIAQSNAETNRLVAVVDEQIAYLQAKKEKIQKRGGAETAFFRSKLCEYFEKVPHVEQKKQFVYKLPSGNLVLKKPAVTYERNDDDIIIWLAKNNGEKYLDSKISVRWGDLKNSDLDLDKIDGLEKVETPSQFEVKV